MRILKNKAFNKWAAKEGVSDQALIDAVAEMEKQQIYWDTHSRFDFVTLQMDRVSLKPRYLSVICDQEGYLHVCVT
jgi:hypothetical protein